MRWLRELLHRSHRRELDLAHTKPGGDRRPLWDGSKVWR